MMPASVAAGLALGRRRRLGGVALQPLLDDVIIKLLCPKHPGERLSLNGAVFAAQAARGERAVKLVRFLPSLRDEPIEIVESRNPRFLDPLQPQPNLARFRRADREPVARRGLRSRAFRIYSCDVPSHDRLVKSILHVRRRVWHTVKQLHVGFILGEEKRSRSFANQSVFTKHVVARFDHPQHLGMIASDAEIRSPPILAPAPGIAKPERWQQVKRGCFRSAICDRRANQDVVLGRLGVFNCDVEVAVLAQNTGVPEFELRLHFGTLSIAPD